MNPSLSLEVVGQGPPLILLHGWGWDSAIWQPLLADLSAHFAVWCIDLPGAGKSRLLAENKNSFADMAECIFNYVPDQASWLGWSLGGMLAFWIASYYPHKVTRLVTIAASPKFVADATWPGISSNVLDDFSKRLFKNYTQTLDDFLLLQLRGSAHAEQLYAALKPHLPVMNPIRLSGLLQGLGLLRTVDLRHALVNMRSPSLHIFGSHDTLVPNVVVEPIQSLLMHGQCNIIKRAGHMPFLSQRDECLALIIPFLKGSDV